MIGGVSRTKRGRAQRVSRRGRTTKPSRRGVSLRGWQQQVFRYGPWAIVGVIVITVLAQLLYPTNRTLPFAQVAGGTYGFKSADQVDEQLRKQFKNAKVTIRVADETVASLPVSTIGARYQKDESVQQALAYPLWQRFIPFSSVIVRPSADTFGVSFDDATLQKIVDEQHKKIQRDPKQATIKITKGTAAIVPGKPGAKVAKNAIKDALKSTKIQTSGTTEVKPAAEQLPPTRRSEDLQPLLKQAEQLLGRSLHLGYAEDKVESVKPEVFGTWITVVENDKKELTLGYDEKKIATYLQDTLSEAIDKPAGVTNIKMVDGVEVSRVNGATGQGIDGAATAAAIGKGLLQDKNHEARVAVKPIPPREEFDRSYTATPRGVAAYVHDMADSGQIAIAVSGSGGSGFGNADQVMTSASTYKLFVAVMLLHKIDAKEIKYSDEIIGTTTEACLDRMIVESDNPCPEALLEKFGRREINKFFHSRGYSGGTNFTNPSSATTTARDLHRLLGDIQEAKDIKPASRDRLLGLMKRQKFRQGIPAGSSGTVANKVGFLGSVLTDAGIVDHPRGSYRIVILTDGQSWEKIAEITKKLESLMYP